MTIVCGIRRFGMYYKKEIRAFCSLIIVLLIGAIITPNIYANAAEPPSATIMVTFPPDNLILSIRFYEGSKNVCLRVLRSLNT